MNISTKFLNNTKLGDIFKKFKLMYINKCLINKIWHAFKENK